MSQISTIRICLEHRDVMLGKFSNAFRSTKEMAYAELEYGRSGILAH
jgi:hypothetical protein